MTNAELDAVCAKWAGWEPTPAYAVAMPGGTVRKFTVDAPAWQLHGMLPREWAKDHKPTLDNIYPSATTDDAAFGRLVLELVKRGYRVTTEPSDYPEKGAYYVGIERPSRSEVYLPPCVAWDDDLKLALARAVAEIAAPGA